MDVDINHGPDYGTAVGWSRTADNDATDDIVAGPAASSTKKITVQYDVDNERFMKMFYERVTAK